MAEVPNCSSSSSLLWTYAPYIASGEDISFGGKAKFLKQDDVHQVAPLSPHHESNAVLCMAFSDLSYFSELPINEADTFVYCLHGALDGCSFSTPWKASSTSLAGFETGNASPKPSSDVVPCCSLPICCDYFHVVDGSPSLHGTSLQSSSQNLAEWWHQHVLRATDDARTEETHSSSESSAYPQKFFCSSIDPTIEALKKKLLTVEVYRSRQKSPPTGCAGGKDSKRKDRVEIAMQRDCREGGNSELEEDETLVGKASFSLYALLEQHMMNRTESLASGCYSALQPLQVQQVDSEDSTRGGSTVRLHSAPPACRRVRMKVKGVLEDDRLNFPAVVESEIDEAYSFSGFESRESLLSSQRIVVGHIDVLMFVGVYAAMGVRCEHVRASPHPLVEQWHTDVSSSHPVHPLLSTHRLTLRVNPATFSINDGASPSLLQCAPAHYPARHSGQEVLWSLATTTANGVGPEANASVGMSMVPLIPGCTPHVMTESSCSPRSVAPTTLGSPCEAFWSPPAGMIVATGGIYRQVVSSCAATESVASLPPLVGSPIESIRCWEYRVNQDRSQDLALLGSFTFRWPPAQYRQRECGTSKTSSVQLEAVFTSKLEHSRGGGHRPVEVVGLLQLDLPRRNAPLSSDKSSLLQRGESGVFTGSGDAIFVDKYSEMVEACFQRCRRNKSEVLELEGDGPHSKMLDGIDSVFRQRLRLIRGLKKSIERESDELKMDSGGHVNSLTRDAWRSLTVDTWWGSKVPVIEAVQTDYAEVKEKKSLLLQEREDAMKRLEKEKRLVRENKMELARANEQMEELRARTREELEEEGRMILNNIENLQQELCSFVGHELEAYNKRLHSKRTQALSKH